MPIWQSLPLGISEKESTLLRITGSPTNVSMVPANTVDTVLVSSDSSPGLLTVTLSENVPCIPGMSFILSLYWLQHAHRSIVAGGRVVQHPRDAPPFLGSYGFILSGLILRVVVHWCNLLTSMKKECRSVIQAVETICITYHFEGLPTFVIILVFAGLFFRVIYAWCRFEFFPLICQAYIAVASPPIPIRKKSR